MTPGPERCPRSSAEADTAGTSFGGLFGLLLGIGLLKFGNPVLLDRLVEMPRSLDEWRAFAWPVRVAYLGLLVVCIGALPVIARPPWRIIAPRLLLALPVVWLLWQFLAATQSIDPATTAAVLPHFCGLVTCFYLGHFVLARVAEPRVFWACLVLGLAGVLGMAFEQRFGGLEATRKMILERPDASSLSPEYLARIQSNRVFSTLVYPNALAGAILLLLPLGTVAVWQFGSRRGSQWAWLLTGAFLCAGLATLVWSGSKAGWLLAMGLGCVVLFHAPVGRRFKVGLSMTILVLGLAGFGIVFADKLRGGATSVSARFDYWAAAVEGVRERPLLGHGPGTFKRVYSRLKRPESEMAQLAHNDYLQQATDSGLPGFLAYTMLVLGSMGSIYRQRRREGSALERAVWLGLLGWFAQGLVEFGLYLPATAWCAFALLGWLLAQRASPDVP